MGNGDKSKLLYVDDEPINLSTFQIAFHNTFEVITAMNGREALDIFTKTPDIAIVVADQRMPDMQGVELLERILRIDPDPIRIILTGYIDIKDILAAINKGHVFSYILKPWVLAELLVTLQNALNFFMVGKERKKLLHELKEKNDELAKHGEALATTNAMLELLLTKYQQSRNEIEKNLITTIYGVVEPILNRMRATCLDAIQKQCLDTLGKKISHITSPIARHLSSFKCNLTPTEIQIVTFLTDGKTTKEISQLLNLSSRTIETHRYNIRKKLGIQDKMVNLRSHLLSLHDSLVK